MIPAYNEARRLPATLAGWREFLGAQPYTWELLVVDDGSMDATSDVATAAGARVLRLKPNQGKGGAVRAGVLAAAGEFIAYADADMNVAPAHLQQALRWLEPADTSPDQADSNLQQASRWLEADAAPAATRGAHDTHPQKSLRRLEVVGGAGDSSKLPNLQRDQRQLGGRSVADLVAGRRDLAQYAAAEGPIRLLAGGLVQLTRRVVVMSAIRDTQCGFKIFRRELGWAIFTRARVRSFAFDIEVLFLARKLGARIVELPVSTTYHPESTFSVRRHLPLFLKDIVQIRLNDLRGRYR